MTPREPTTNQPETDDVKVNRAYLRGFDDAQNAIDQGEPIEGMPEDIQIADVDGRQLIVSPTDEGVVVRGFHPRPSDADVLRLAQELGAARHRVRSALDMLNATPHVVAEMDRDNANAFSDALGWAARGYPSR